MNLDQGSATFISTEPLGPESDELKSFRAIKYKLSFSTTRYLLFSSITSYRKIVSILNNQQLMYF